MTVDHDVDPDRRAADLSLALVQAATGAHVALRLAWPGHAGDLARTAVDLADQLADAIEPLRTETALAREHDERRTGTDDALAELNRRHRARLGQRAATDAGSPS